MLQTFLTPLRARFDLSPRTPTTPLAQAAQHAEPDEISPEDFARDVITELMRNSVENLKLAEDTKTRQQVGLGFTTLKPALAQARNATGSG